jgi:hypothetical protein
MSKGFMRKKQGERAKNRKKAQPATNVATTIAPMARRQASVDIAFLGRRGVIPMTGLAIFL